MCSRAANNQSLGGVGKKRIRVVVGEGWFSYFYLDSMNTAAILLSVGETFLRVPSQGTVAQDILLSIIIIFF